MPALPWDLAPFCPRALLTPRQRWDPLLKEHPWKTIPARLTKQHGNAARLGDLLIAQESVAIGVGQGRWSVARRKRLRRRFVQRRVSSHTSVPPFQLLKMRTTVATDAACAVPRQQAKSTALRVPQRRNLGCGAVSLVNASVQVPFWATSGPMVGPYPRQEVSGIKSFLG